jgi:protein-tyrosine kinase
MSLIERAAERLLAEQRQNDGVQPLPAAPQAPEVMDTAEPYLIDEGVRAAQTIHLDAAHLVARGCLTSAEINTPLAMEFRRAKRPLLHNVKAEIQAHGHPNRRNLILITSAVPGEGKSFVSTNLALSIASEIDQTVLLIDADVMRRGAASTLGLEHTSGLLDVVAGERTVEEVLLHTSIPSLTFIPAGTTRPNADELYASDAMRLLIEEIGTRYADRIILIDSPPVLATNVPSILVKMIGQVLFVVEADRTPQHIVIDALQQLEGCDQIGLLLNKGSRRLSGHAYGYGYGYGYGESPT